MRGNADVHLQVIYIRPKVVHPNSWTFIARVDDYKYVLTRVRTINVDNIYVVMP